MKKDLTRFTSQDVQESAPHNKIDGAVEYDLVDNVSKENAINGKMPKKFVRLASRYFTRFFEEREKGTCFYETCFTVEDDEMGYVPNHVPTLVKQRAMKRDDVFETYAPAVLNFFEVPTVFNTTCEDSQGYGYIASIDFIKPDETFMLYQDLGCGEYDFGSYLNLEQSVECVSKALVEFFEKNNLQLSQEVYDKHVSQFVKSYLTRICLMGDLDFSARNSGILINEKTRQVRPAPNFDFELCFRFDPKHITEKDLIFAADHYPAEYEMFLEKLNLFMKKKDGVAPYQDLHDQICDSTRYRETIFEFIEKQSKLIESVNQNVKINI